MHAVQLDDYLYVLLRRRHAVLAIFLIFAVPACLRAYLARNVFEGTAQILIEHVAPQVLNFKDITADDGGSGDYYQTQYNLLRSRSLAERAVLELNLLADPEYGGPRTPEAIEAIKAMPQGQSRALQGAVDAFLGRLSINPARNSRLVAVSFASFRPELAAAGANTLARLYIAQSLEFRSKTSSEAAQWLETQIADQRKKVEAAEIALQHLKEQEGIVNLEERRALLDQKFGQLGSTITALKTQRLQKEALYRQMQRTANPEELPEVMASPYIQNLRSELGTLERQETQLLDLYVERHPEVVKVRSQIQEMRKRIASEIQRVISAAENEYRAAVAQEASVSSALEAAKAETIDLSRRGLQYDSLKAELGASKEVLNGLLSSSKQTDVAQELTSSNIRIVDLAAVPRRPVRPNRKRDVLTGMILGLAAGIGVALFLDQVDNTLKTPDDVQRYLGVPLLGVISEQSEKTDDRTLLNPSLHGGATAEGYRVLRTALTYSWSEPGGRIVMVTSTAPSEGKTLTSVNLALVLATMEGEVLLIDADLRRPTAHSLLGVRPSPGLSDLLVGKATPVQVIKAVRGSRLSVLPSGTHVPSPSELMTGKAMKGFLESLRSVYKWVIIDTPPVGAVTEPVILAPMADGVVIIAGAEMLPRRAIIRTVQRVSETGARILGVVLSRAKLEKHSYYYAQYYGVDYGRYHARPDEKTESRS